MKLIAKMAAAAAVVLFGSNAMAADIIPVAVVTTPVVVVDPAPPAFDWSGLYVGVYGGYNTTIPPIAAGVQVGYNFVTGSFLAGVEARIGGFTAPGFGFFDFEGSINLRAGYIIGERVLVYGTAGVGHVFCCNYTYWSAGGGLEIGLGERLSIFGEARAFNDLPSTGAPVGLMIRGGLNFHL